MGSRPFVTTFYSYKSGVGRSTLAANVAVALARQGKTLLWDLDTEAPGLEQISALKTGKPVKRGYFGALVEWQKAKCPATLNKTLLKAWDAALYAVQAQPDLSLLPAAPDAKALLRDAIQIDWDGFFGREPEKGSALIDALLAHWAGQGFDFVVIDAPGGISDLAAVTTALVPDVTVLVGNFGLQSTNGLQLAWQALQPATGDMPRRAERGLPPLERELIASPIPQGDASRLAAGRALWQQHFGLKPAEWIEIPENEALRFSEAIALLEYPQDHVLVQKYQEVARRVLAARERQQAVQHADASASALYPELMPVRRGLLHPGERGREAQERGRRFEDQVAHVLQLLRYTVERETLVDANRIDLIASTSGTLEDVTWFVECKETSVTKDMVDKLDGWIRQPQAMARGARAMIVGRSFAPAAQQSAKNYRMACFTLAQLEEKLFNFKPYLAQLRLSFEQSRLAQCYVSQYVKRNRTSSAAGDEASDEREELLPLAVDWATGKGRPLWVLLGDYGTGKTAFTQRFAYELARRGETDPATPVPLLINLRDYPNATSLETVIDEHLAKTGQERGRAGAILHLLAQGRCVLLLDSFDEMGLAAVGVSVEEQFRQLARPTADARAPAGGRVLVTCREEFFKERKEAEAAISGSGDRLARPGSALEQAAKAFDAQIDALPYFDHEQVREYLEKRLGEREAAEALARIDSIHGLSDLATRPQLLEIVLESLPELVKQGKAVSPGVLYYTYVNRWLQRHRPVGARLSVGQVVQLLELLAQTLWARGAAPLHYSDLAKAVHGYQAVFPKIDPVHVDLELRTAAFLTRSPEGLYRFSHRSFLEFFYACRLLRLAQEKDEAGFVEALSGTPLRVEVVWFFADLWLGNGHEGPCTLTARLLAVQQVPMAAANLFRLAWWLGKYASENQDAGAEHAVWQQVLPEHMQLAGVDLSDMDLSSAPLAGAVLERAVLDRCSFKDANLDGASLRGAQVRDVNFSGASCRSLNAEEIDGVSSRWQAARVEKAIFSRAMLRNSDWRRARLEANCFTNTDLSLSLLDASQEAQVNKCILQHASTWAGILGKIGQEKVVPQWRRLPMDAVQGVAFSPDGMQLASAGGDGIVRIWDAISGRELRRLEGHEGWVWCVAFSPDSTLLASAGIDGRVRVWEAASGHELRHLKGHGGWIRSISFSPDGKCLASGGDDGCIRVWNLISGQESNRLEGHGRWVWSVAFSPAGSLLASGGEDGRIRIWDVTSGQRVRQLEGHGSRVCSVAFSSDGTKIVSGGNDGRARVWDANSGQELCRLEGHSDWVRSVAFSPDNTRLASSGDDSRVLLWDAINGRQLKCFDGHLDWAQGVAFSADGKKIVSGGNDGTLRIWEVCSGRELHQLDGIGDWVWSVIFSPDGKLIISGGDDEYVRVWEAATGRELCRLNNHGGPIQSVGFSPDGTQFASAGSGGSVRFWNAANGQELRSIRAHKGFVLSIAFSLDGIRFASGGGDRKVRVWDLASGRELSCLDCRSQLVRCVAFSPNGTQLAVGCNDGAAYIYDLSNAQEVICLECACDWVQTLSFSDDGKWLASGGGGDGTVQVWEVSSGRQVHRLEGCGEWIQSIAFLPNSTQFASGGDDGVVRLWDAVTGQELAQINGFSGGIKSLAFARDGSLVTAGSLLKCYELESLNSFDNSMSNNGWRWQTRITPTGDPVTLYPDGTHYGEGEALEWLEYAEYGLKPDGTPDPIPTLHRATDAPWLRRGPVKEDQEKTKKGKKKK